MPFDFELLFTGLCLFTFQGDPKQPEAVDVLLAKTGNGHGPGTGNGHTARTGNGGGAGPHAGAEESPHRHGADGEGNPPQAGHRHGGVAHVPVLTYTFSDLTVRSQKPCDMLLDPDGELIARRRLESEEGMLELEVVPPGGFAGALTTVWRPASEPRRQVPRTEEDEAWLDWALRLNRILPDLPAGNGNGNSLAAFDQRAVSARIRLTRGSLRSLRVARGLNRDYLLWHFADEKGVFDRRESQAIAEAIVLRLEGLTAPVQIRGLGELLELAPPVGSKRTLVKASITNFPSTPVNEGDRLEHLTKGYLDLVAAQMAQPNTHLRFVTNADHLDTQGNPLCPPGTH
jgi:hypothetical protein